MWELLKNAPELHSSRVKGVRQVALVSPVHKYLPAVQAAGGWTPSYAATRVKK